MIIKILLKCSNVKMNKGFTLMEAIVAIFVITTGLVGVLSLVSQTIASSTFSKDKLIAAYLAQEGIEIIRNIRDTNWLNGVAWNTGLTATPNTNVNYNSSNVSDMPDGLSFDGSYYVHSASPNTPFSRHIEITYDVDGDGNDDLDPGGNLYRMNVKVVVEWQEKGKIHKVEAQENLYNWYQK
jgi:type II secretory pathway pseudopilin PulG